MAEATRSASEQAEESSGQESKEGEAEKPKSETDKPADREAFLITEKFLTEALGVRYSVNVSLLALREIFFFSQGIYSQWLRMFLFLFFFTDVCKLIFIF